MGLTDLGMVGESGQHGEPLWEAVNRIARGAGVILGALLGGLSQRGKDRAGRSA